MWWCFTYCFCQSFQSCGVCQFCLSILLVISSLDVPGPLSQLEFISYIKLELHWNLCLRKFSFASFCEETKKTQVSQNVQSWITAWKRVLGTLPVMWRTWSIQVKSRAYFQQFSYTSWIFTITRLYKHLASFWFSF